MHGVGVAEEVVQVAEDFLVRADEEHAEVVRLAGERVQRERALDVAAIDELIDLAVRVAGDVAEHGLARRRFVQPVNRHHREQLLDRPRVGNRLEQREVAEVRVGERVVEALQILRHVLHLSGTSLRSFVQIAQYSVSAMAALLERQVAAVEQVERHVERLLRVVIALERVARREVLVRLFQVDERLLDLVAVAVLRQLFLAEARRRRAR